MAKDTEFEPIAVVCVPSFRRPQGLLKTLQSLAVQRVEFPFAVVVVDNDAKDQAAMSVAGAFFASGKLTGQVVLERQQGNVFAINRAFETARGSYPSAQYLLMMDDDEEATELWLASMVGAAKSFGADIVGGPVRRRFEAPAPASISQHPLFLSIETESGPISQIHGSGNCLLSRRVFERLENGRFDPQFNFLGGGDMDFFTRCRKAGLVSAWSSEALIYEDVPASRMAAKWIMERSLRTGIINYSIDRAHRPGAKGAVLLMLKNIISLGLSVPRALIALVRSREWLIASHPILMSLGRMLASFGITLSPYKATSITGQHQS
jgi:glycosyltransferase involved in cell wall biosynthesis